MKLYLQLCKLGHRSPIRLPFLSALPFGDTEALWSSGDRAVWICSIFCSRGSIWPDSVSVYWTHEAKGMILIHLHRCSKSAWLDLWHARGVVSSGLFGNVSFFRGQQTSSQLTSFTFGGKWGISCRTWWSSAQMPLTALAVPQQETERRGEQLSARKTLNAEQMWVLGKQRDCLSWQIYCCGGEVPSGLCERHAGRRSCWSMPWKAAGSMNAASLPFPVVLGSTINIMQPWDPHAVQHLLLSPLSYRRQEENGAENIQLKGKGAPAILYMD